MWMRGLRKKIKKCSHLKQHVFLTGSQIHFVLVIVDTDVDNVCQQFLIAWNHLQLLVQALRRQEEALFFSLCVRVRVSRLQNKKDESASFRLKSPITGQVFQ